MARTKTFTNSEVDSLLKTMRAGGVLAFKYKGLEVQFAPQFAHAPTDGSLDDDPFIAAERVKAAVEKFNQVNKDEDLDMEWSV